MKQHRSHIFGVILLSAILISGPWSVAMAQEDDEKYGFELGAHLGNLLPNQIDGVTEITPQWGLKMGFPNPGGAVEFGAMTGRGEGVIYSYSHLSLRVDVPIEQMLGHFIIGVNAHHYESPDLDGAKSFGGGHMGGGISTAISKTLWFRTDMMFNVNPGTSLYFGFGFMFRFPDSGDDADDEKK